MVENEQSIGKGGTLTPDGLFIEVEPGVYYSPPRFATERIEVSPEFRKYAKACTSWISIA